MSDEWKNDLLLNNAGEPRPQLANAIVAFRKAPVWSGVFAYNEFAHETMLKALPPWVGTSGKALPRSWTPHDDLLAANRLQQEGIGVTPAVAQQAVEAVSRDKSYHPVVDYLERIEHDGEPRLATWLSTYMGSADTPYHREVGRIVLIGAVARIFKPGCKVDTVPIFEGSQGAQKSTAIKMLFDPWFTDDLEQIGKKDAAMQIRGVWGVEIGELDAMSRSHISKVKAFLSRTHDRYRPPYGSRVMEFPRSCTFWGTTNADHYLRDETGNRRFLPIKVRKINIARLRADHDQLWAEAVAKFRAGALWWIADGRLQADAEKEQRDRYTGDPWDGFIQTFTANRNEVTIDEVLGSMCLKMDRWGQTEQTRVARSLRSMSWERKQRRTGDDREWVYRRPATNSENDPTQSG